MYLNLFSSTTAQEYIENPFQVIDFVGTTTALPMKCILRVCFACHVTIPNYR